MTSAQEFSGTSLITGVVQLSRMTLAIAENRLAISPFGKRRTRTGSCGSIFCPCGRRSPIELQTLVTFFVRRGQLKGADDEEEALGGSPRCVSAQSRRARPGSYAQVDVQGPTPHR